MALEGRDRNRTNYAELQPFPFNKTLQKPHILCSFGAVLSRTSKVQ